MDPLHRLSSLFERFPGIGPRQASRFVHYLLRSSPALRTELVAAIQELSLSVHQCISCMRFSSSPVDECSLCSKTKRDQTTLAVVASDGDIDALERSNVYDGRYFVLGGTISLASEQKHGLRFIGLLQHVDKHKKYAEVIMAFPANPEGDATAIRTQDELLAKFPKLKVSMLGRGLSSGSELEYADSETLRTAIQRRQ